MLAGGMYDYLISACSSSIGTRTRRPPPGGTSISVSTPAPSSPVFAADDASRAAAAVKQV
jgi:hypothetical protein